MRRDHKNHIGSPCRPVFAFPFGLEIRTFAAIVFAGFAKVLRRLSASTIDCDFLAFDICCNVTCIQLF